MSSSSVSSSIQGLVQNFIGSTNSIAGTSGSVPTPPAGSQTLFLSGNGSFSSPILYGSGSPQSVVTASVGNSYFDISSSLLYIKATGSSNTGWVVYGSSSVPNIIRFLSSGTYTPSTNIKYAIIEMVGGGGGGGGSIAYASGAVGISTGTGGGSGSYGKFLATAAQLGSSVSVTIGAGGIGNSGAAGSSGGNTIFGTLATAPGGAGGSVASSSSSTGSLSSAGSQSGGSTFAFTLNTGTLILTAGTNGGGVCNYYNQLSAIGGAGGSNPLSVGAPQNYSWVGSTSLSQSGFASYGFGGGGSGGVSGRADFIPSASAASSGGTGLNGVVIVSEYF